MTETLEQMAKRLGIKLRFPEPTKRKAPRKVTPKDVVRNAACTECGVNPVANRKPCSCLTCQAHFILNPPLKAPLSWCISCSVEFARKNGKPNLTYDIEEVA